MARTTPYIGWPGGAYAASGVLGTRSVAAAAGAFTAMAAFGRHGYERLTLDVMHTTRRLQQGLHEVAALTPVGTPPMSVFAATGERVPSAGSPPVSRQRGWWIDAQSSPAFDPFHRFSRVTPRSSTPFLHDLGDVRRGTRHRPWHDPESALPSSYGVMVRGGAALTEAALFAVLDERFDGPGGS